MMVKSNHPWIIDSVAGAGAGIFSTFVCLPLDVAKTRLQVQFSIQGVRKYSGIFGTLKSIWREERLPGLYRGLEPSLVTVPFFWSTYFPIYDWVKERLERRYPQHPIMDHCVAAVCAGAIVDIMTNPLWVVRTRMMTHVYHGDEFGRMHTLAALRFITRTEGFRGLYKGLMASMFGLSHVGIQFPLYEELRRTLASRHDDNHATKIDLVLASASSKFAATCVTYPHEVARARMHDFRGHGHIGFMETMLKIFRNEGVPGFYQGLGTNLVRVLPSCVATFVSYELLKEHLTKTFGH